MARVKGDLPDEFKRRSLVSVPKVSVAKTEFEGSGGLVEIHNYIVTTSRLDGDWKHGIEYRGQVFQLPAKVFDSIVRQRGSIISEQRKTRAKEVTARLRAMAERDQEEALAQGQ